MTKPPFVDPKPSPPPKTRQELSDTVTRTHDRTKQLVEIYMPRLERVAVEARDGVIVLENRVSALERTSAHICDEKDRQRRQDDDILAGKVESVEQAEQIKGLSAFRKVIIGSILTVAGAAIWFALATSSESSSQSERLDANTKTLERHEEILAELPRKSDIENLRQSVSNDVKSIPRVVRELESQEPSTAIEVDQAAQDLQRQKILRESEYDTIRFIQSRAEKRSNGGSND